MFFGARGGTCWCVGWCLNVFGFLVVFGFFEGGLGVLVDCFCFQN